MRRPRTARSGNRLPRVRTAPIAGSFGILEKPMNPARKRRVRLVVALTAALLLASALVYTSFSASSEAVTPSRLAASAASGRAYQLTGKVVDRSVRDIPGGKTFRVRDRNGTISVPVRYVGAVPDPFREGREVIVTVRKQGEIFVGERDSLVTKCPSKFSDQTQPSQKT
jgi:cytochrome c-type biogenesis protein CcmE